MIELAKAQISGLVFIKDAQAQFGKIFGVRLTFLIAARLKNIFSLVHCYNDKVSKGRIFYNKKFENIN
jgi:hypothetical protein